MAVSGVILVVSGVILVVSGVILVVSGVILVVSGVILVVSGVILVGSGVILVGSGLKGRGRGKGKAVRRVGGGMQQKLPLCSSCINMFHTNLFRVFHNYCILIIPIFIFRLHDQVLN